MNKTENIDSLIFDEIERLSSLPVDVVLKIVNDKTNPPWKIAAAVRVLKGAKSGNLKTDKQSKLSGSDFQSGWERNLSGGVISAAIGVSSGRLTQLTRDGCPRNKDGSYCLPDVVKWYRKRAVDVSGRSPLQDEKTKAEIELLRAKISNLQDTTMLKTDHKEILNRLICNIKDFWLSGCRKIAPDFINCPDAITAQNILTQFVQHGLNTIAGKR
jgi:hypothetical protein